MDLRRARTFVTVADLGTVSAAAQQLRITQPALSRQIGDLEQEFGVKLFDRVGRRLLLTSDGEQLLDDFRGLLNHAGAVGERARLLRQGDTGVLKVAAAPVHIESVFPHFLLRYAERYPNVQVKLIDVVGSKMLGMLERGEIHLGQSLATAVQPDSRHFASQPLHAMDLLAAYHPRLALCNGSTIEIGGLAPYPLLLMDSENVVRRTFDAACRLADLKPNIALESHAPHSLLGMAEAGHGVAIIPSALQTHNLRLRIVGIAYRGKRLGMSIIILWDKRRPRTPYAAAFCEMLAEYMHEVYPITRPTETKTKSGKTKQMTARGTQK